MTTNTVPRRIEGHEIKPGQVIANHFEEDGSGCRGVVVRVEKDKAMVAESRNEMDFNLSPVFFDSTITLLEEAPRIGEAIARKDIRAGDRIAAYGYPHLGEGQLFTVDRVEHGWIHTNEGLGSCFDIATINPFLELRLVERKPERRGEIIKPADVRTGDVLDLYMEFGGDLVGVVAQPRQASPGGWTRALRKDDGSLAGRIVRRTGGWDEIRLVERPELPATKGSVIAVHTFAGEWFSEPVFAMVDHTGDWFRVDGDRWPDGNVFSLGGRTITDWSPAKAEYTIGEAA